MKLQCGENASAAIPEDAVGQVAAESKARKDRVRNDYFGFIFLEGELLLSLDAPPTASSVRRTTPHRCQGE
jgi:hypothetical protein